MRPKRYVFSTGCSPQLKNDASACGKAVRFALHLRGEINKD
ncbi:hypothetical protein SynPROS91_02203 [Synechococcus sp. PROS-9-1]|nr:hypothetical protein SynPROS91_02203 [Synechococcus sp. PROS-9-1]